MCQLFGFSSQKPVGFRKEWNEFIGRSNDNPHAWGASLWPDLDAGPMTVREPRQANRSYAASMIGKLKGYALVGHIRYGTVKPLASVVNAHPFTAFIKGEDWSLAHNGFLRDVDNDAEFSMVYVPNGTTDSEAFFACLVDAIAAHNRKLTAILATAKKYARSGKLNFLLSNGKELYWFSNHDGLWFKENAGVVAVATKPLGDSQEWVQSKPGTLYAAMRGEIVLDYAVEKSATYMPKKHYKTREKRGRVRDIELPFIMHSTDMDFEITPSEDMLQPAFDWGDFKEWVEEKKGGVVVAKKLS